VRLRKLGAHVFAAEFFAEEVRRQIQREYGEEKLYGGGLSVRTTLEPRLQRMARNALMGGLAEFDRRKGWRGPVSKIDISGDWGKGLIDTESPDDISPWRLGVVLSANAEKAVVGLKPAKKQDGKLVDAREAVEIAFEEVKWAKSAKTKKVPKAVTDILSPGDVIYVAPKDPDDISGVWSLMQIPEVGGGIVAMDPHTGRVLAVVGGFSFRLSQFDRAMQARRQPGSAFKPFVYATAIENGYKPTSIVLDAPIEIAQGPGQDIWRPENYEKEKSGGPSTLRFGIEKSRNQMTVRLAQDIGMPMITEYAKRFGIYDDLLPVLSMSLGAGETTLLRLATGYCMLANGGRQVRATLIDRIQDRWGRTVWRHDQRVCENCKAEEWTGQDEPQTFDDRQQIIDPHTAYQMTSILEGVVQHGTGRSLKKLERPLAGKTGTTNEEKDAWFVGYSPDLVVGVFVGYDTPRPMGKGQTGGRVAAPIFGAFMKKALADKPATPFRIPPGIKLVRVNHRTGLRASADQSDTIMEAFKPGEGPDDAYSVIGLSEVTETGSPSNDAYQPAPQRPNFGSGRGGLW
jgi:penicillin-binding protein 1A